MTSKLPTMPALPRVKKVKPTRPCACGCGMATKSEWHSGHDGRATGWALRIERGLMSIDEVPANERRGAEIMLARHAAKAKREAAMAKLVTAKAS